MSWRHWLTDARTGMIVRPIDIPSFAWTMSIGDFGFTTTAKNLGEADVSNLTLPWSQFDEYDDAGVLVHRATPAELNHTLGMGRRALCSSWVYEGVADRRGTPILWGALGEREDSWLDVTFPLYSPMTLMGSRYAIRDGAFQDGRSTDTVSWTGLSLRGLASNLIDLAVNGKNGGALPFDCTYINEPGSHQRTDYKAWNVQNLDVKSLLTNIANVQGGPDMTFRPYWSDGSHVRVRHLAGSDADIYLDTDHAPLALNSFPGGGSLEELKISYATPIQRVYATGAGTDESVVTAIAEDLSQVTGSIDPPILRETAYSDTDAANVANLKPKALSVLDANKHTMMQLTGSIDVDDTDAVGRPIHPLGSFWPGQACEISVTGHRTLPDGTYTTRLMEMSGDQSGKVTVKFDVMDAPF
ncbi:hypothetical protein [Bifidobacterium psychraerophilum]|uniref:hypothetical protein n=1 Tax=Bifidobacterium psychraerophilum TaxID=218140 RepID=UPI0039ECCC9B